VSDQMDSTKQVDLEELKTYLRGCYKVDGKLPSIKTLAERYGVSEYKMNEVFRILVHEGFLHLNFSRYKMPSPSTEQVERPAIPEIAENAIAPARFGSDGRFEWGLWVITTIRIALGLVGIGAIGVSIYYTAIWLMEGLSPFLAILLSSIMSVFSAMAFEVVVILSRKRQILMTIGFAVLWIVVLVFSMVSTIAGQYNHRIKAENIQVSDSSAISYKAEVYDLTKAEEASVLSQIEEKKRQKEVLLKLYEQFDTLEKQKADSRTFNDLTSKLAVVDREIQQFSTSLSGIRAKLQESLNKETVAGLTEETITRNDSFYVWVASSLGAAPIHVEFWLSVFPAVFVDLIAPFALAFALFQRRKE